VRLLYGARSPADLLFAPELAQWAAMPRFRVEVTVDHAEPDWRGEVGVVTRLIKPGSMARDTMALVCGPETMMDFTVRSLLAAGVAPEGIYVTMERNMACAVGHCGRCQLGPWFVCRDGPVFRYDRIARLFAREGF
jgi:NAD(P)H-flavin reductase